MEIGDGEKEVFFFKKFFRFGVGGFVKAFISSKGLKEVRGRLFFLFLVVL